MSFVARNLAPMACQCDAVYIFLVPLATLFFVVEILLREISEEYIFQRSALFINYAVQNHTCVNDLPDAVTSMIITFWSLSS